MLKENKIIKAIARYKVHTDRARGYIGMAQFIMLSVILAKQFNIKLGIIGTILIVIITFVAYLIIGFLDNWLGIRREETEIYVKQNKLFMEIYDKLQNDVKK